MDSIEYLITLSNLSINCGLIDDFKRIVTMNSFSKYLTKNKTVNDKPKNVKIMTCFITSASLEVVVSIERFFLYISIEIERLLHDRQ